MKEDNSANHDYTTEKEKLGNSTVNQSFTLNSLKELLSSYYLGIKKNELDIHIASSAPMS